MRLVFMLLLYSHNTKLYLYIKGEGRGQAKL